MNNKKSHSSRKMMLLKKRKSQRRKERRIIANCTHTLRTVNLLIKGHILARTIQIKLAIARSKLPMTILTLTI
ncbi:hypothetical protein FGO68_gene8740 [Halteria grandinella]|uniref:Uncharacterized protein n=1 Tax=Halteria grandinella TaxID=5974 RepID=A0A8J8NR07_HALGN|nr:hypothetical protein FGO68_gene8740 [Halteria grandinella]